MRFAHDQKSAHNIAVCLQAVCWLMVLLAAMVLALALLGRVEMSITTPTGHYDHALLMEKDHSATSRYLFTQISDQRVFLHTDGQVGFVTWLGVVLMGAARVVPMGLCFLCLSVFFRNISLGNVFVTTNARLLQKSGGILLLAAVATPFLNGLILPGLVNALSPNKLMISTNISFSQLFFGAALLVMAYVFHYGIYLQQEADQTI